MIFLESSIAHIIVVELYKLYAKFYKILTRLSYLLYNELAIFCSEGKYMSRLQELIKEYSENNEKSTYREIIGEIQNAEVLYSAFSPITKGHFVDYVQGMPAAFIFSEKKYCEDYCSHMKKEGNTVGVAECKKDSRLAMLSDYHRSGYEAVLVDNGKNHLLIPLTDLINVPDFSSIPEEQRPVINPSLVCSANRFFQCLENKTVTPDKEINLLTDTYKARFLMPIEGSPENGSVTIPILSRNDGAKVMPFFTDITELRKFDKEEKYRIAHVPFAQIESICNENQTVVINPFGFNFNITKETCEGIHNAVNLTPDTNAERAVIFTPERVSKELTDKLSRIFDENGKVNKAFIKSIRKSSGVETLVVIECGDSEEEANAALEEIKESAKDITEGTLTFTLASSNLGRISINGASPFFEKFIVDVSISPQNYEE